MSTTTRCAQRLLLTVVVIALLFVRSALAFNPYGYFGTTSGGQFSLVKWPLTAFDTDGDDDVQGDEGLVLNFEVGNGEDGFDQSEAVKILDGYQEWQHVSTAYAAFQRGGNITDPVELESGIDSIDAFNVVQFESEADVAEQGGSVTAGLFEVTLIANSFDETFVTIGTTTISVSPGQMLDVDTVFATDTRDAETQEGGLLRAGGVYAGGLTLGIGYSPLSNIDEEASDTANRFIEDRVVAIRNFDGTIGLRGVTSSMFNQFVFYDDGGNNFVCSANDLAPDDIAAVTFMYPRSDLDIFFDLNQRARTRARDNFPSQPISGAWIRAWCDADNNSASARVPMFDTLTGLYYDLPDVNFRGHFQLKNLFKQLETINEQTFGANYVLSCSEFLPLVLNGDDRSHYDTTHGHFSGETSDIGITFDSLFPAEVFNENGNLFGLSSISQGTPLIFDLITRKIVSQNSGKTLDTILATGRPMFGDQDQTCPLNVIVGPIDTGGGDTGALMALRKFRDNMLLTNPIGTAVADTYYRIAPAAAAFFVKHATLTAAAGRLVAPIRWIVVNAEYLLLVTAALLTALTVRRRARRVQTAALVVFAALALGSPIAGAQMLPLEISDYLAQADDVVVGKVGEIESRWINNNTKIISDIAIEVEQAVKGTQNKESVVHLQFPTGRVGAVGRSSPQLPEFKTGEEVLVFLDAQKKGYMVVGGIAGKYMVVPHPKTGQKYVFATSMPGHIRLEREIAKMNQQQAPDGVELANTSGPMKIDFTRRTLVKLDDFVKYLRALDKQQQKHTLPSAENGR